MKPFLKRSRTGMCSILLASLIMAASVAGCGQDSSAAGGKTAKSGNESYEVKEDGSVEVPEAEPVEGSIDYISSQYSYEDEPNYFEGHDPNESKNKTGKGSVKNETGKKQEEEDQPEAANDLQKNPNGDQTGDEASEKNEDGGLHITG